MNAIEWLHNHAPGFADLSVDEREAIMQFSLLWSLFESGALKTNGSAKAVVDLTSHWVAQGALADESFVQALTYFRNRYVTNGGFTHHFGHLHFRNGDRQELVERVLRGDTDAPGDIAAGVLIVVFRYRNNYLHGMKWAYQLRGQLGNFTAANAALMEALELYDRYGAA